jgi:site-specific DNA-cytosine methylase
LMDVLTYKALFLFSGIGGGALGFQESSQEFRGNIGRIETLCGIDVDPEICADFEAITGAPAACMDLFNREQYTAFHGQTPPVEWREVTPADIRRACRGIAPDVVFTSPPCKGFSGLLPTQSAKTDKYQALNKLTIRGLKLIAEAFKDELPKLILLENVPRITTRGANLIKQIKALLSKYGYVFNDAYHDCGEIGGLAQHRRRYLLIARNEAKMPAFVYKPPVQRVRAIGEVISELPMPGDEAGGPMHRLPRLAWKTWVRLALIPAGGDWRDLQSIDHTKYCLSYQPRSGACSVEAWDKPYGAVTGGAGFGRSNGVAAIADPRFIDNEKSRHTTHYRVSKWAEAAGTVTGASHVANGRISIADPRLANGSRYTSKWELHSWNGIATAITGTPDIQSGAPSIADPRISCSPRSGTMGVMDWNKPGKTVIGAGDIHAGAAAIVDPRVPGDIENGIWVILAEDGTWHRPLTTYELAMLQSFSTHLADGRPFQLSGKSDAKWRERIGNAVPAAAGEAIADVMLTAMMASAENMWILSPTGTDIWVVPADDPEPIYIGAVQ